MAQKPRDQITCGSCVHLQDERLPGCKTTCINNGKIITSKTCGGFKPNYKIIPVQPQLKSRFELLAEAVYGMAPSELSLMAALLLQERKTRKQGYHLYQKIYIRYRGTATANYFSNFLVGYIIYADSEYVRVVGEKSSMSLQLITEKESFTYYTMDRFDVLRKTMQERRAYIDPTIAQEEAAANSARIGAISTFDEVVDKKVAINKKIQRKKASADDLVSIVTRMQRGVLRGSKTTKDVTIDMHW